MQRVLRFFSGAIRVVNNTGQTRNVTDVLVTIGSATFDLWNTGGAFTVGAGTDEVLAQTFGQNFDTSDFGNAFAPGNSIQPTKKLTLSLGAGTSQSITFTDSGQVLNTGGFDLANAKPCPGANNPNVSGPCNESLPWRDVGTSGTNDPGGGETPEPASLFSFSRELEEFSPSRVGACSVNTRAVHVFACLSNQPPSYA
ncbi:MAG TPA: hypothetical protein VGR84_03620 [Candidatus Acidoferrales bacterium]|nr:hypothetical protein [Candidatus Acidoferrales bacterium]